MSAVAALKPDSSIEKIRSVKPGQLFVFGKINAIDKFQRKNKEICYRTRVLMKDKTDDFAHPMPVDIVASAALGALGELWEGVVDIKTFRKDYRTQPNEDGEVKNIKQLTLDCYYVD
jgi:hypothetical protein